MGKNGLTGMCLIPEVLLACFRESSRSCFAQICVFAAPDDLWMRFPRHDNMETQLFRLNVELLVFENSIDIGFAVNPRPSQLRTLTQALGDPRFSL